MMKEGYRHEYKYLISACSAQLLKRRLPHVMARDPHAGPTGQYTIRSLYFDDGNYSAYEEKMSGVAAEAYRRHGVKPGDLFVVISASGKNAAPVEMLRCAKAHGIKTVAISSSAYREHGGVLLDDADLPIDCKVPHGDAVIAVGDAMMGGLSTSASCFILNSILICGAKKALESGTTPPVYTSGNVAGGTEKNLAIEERYFGRVRHL